MKSRFIRLAIFFILNIAPHLVMGMDDYDYHDKVKEPSSSSWMELFYINPSFYGLGDKINPRLEDASNAIFGDTILAHPQYLAAPTSTLQNCHANSQSCKGLILQCQVYGDKVVELVDNYFNSSVLSRSTLDKSKVEDTTAFPKHIQAILFKDLGEQHPCFNWASRAYLLAVIARYDSI